MPNDRQDALCAGSPRDVTGPGALFPTSLEHAAGLGPVDPPMGVPAATMGCVSVAMVRRRMLGHRVPPGSIRP